MNSAQLSPTAAEFLWPQENFKRDALLVFGASFFIALCAQIAIPLPFTPVPLSGSTFGVLSAGAFLGSRRGIFAVLLYLTLAAVGLPVLAGGAAGWAHLFGPTGGYLLGFLPGAFIAGFLAEHSWDRTPLKAFLLMLIASSAILACGLVTLSHWVPRERLFLAGLYPFIPGDLIKSAVAAGLFPGGWAWINKRRT